MAQLATVLAVEVVFAGPLLLWLRSRRPPFGGATALLAATGALTAAISSLPAAGVLAGALAGGLAADLAIAGAAPGRGGRQPLLRTALALSAAWWLVFFVAVAASGGRATPVATWLGTTAWAGACGLALALVAQRLGPDAAARRPAARRAPPASPIPDRTDPRLRPVADATDPWPPRAAGAAWPAEQEAAPAADEEQALPAAPRPGQPYRLGSAVSAGLVLGIMWWILISMTLQPLLLHQGATWTVQAAAARFPDLIGSLLGGAVIAVGIQLSVEWMLVNRKAPPDLTRYGRTVTRVVIAGGGFAGVSAAKQLEQLAVRSALDVTLVSSSNYLLFTPMLAEVASRSLEAGHIGAPVRAACPRTRFRRAALVDVDPERHLALVRASGSARVEALPYDHLVLALGVVPDYHGLPGVREHSFPFKTLQDATRLHNHVIGLLEEADVESDPVERQRTLTFVVAGGGFAGTEVIASIHDLVHEVLHYFPSIRVEDVRFVLVHSRERILPELGPELADYSMRKLRGRGIEFLLRTRVAGATGAEVALSDGRTIPARTLVWTASDRPNPLLDELPFERSPRGTLLVDPTLRVKGRRDVWALGDCARVPDPRSGGKPQPATAQHALREGSCVARNIAAVVAGRSPKPFSFRSIGFIVSLGRQTAAAELRGLRFSGLPAWLIWRGVYLSKLPSVDKRLRVLLDWTIGLFFPRDIALTGVDDRSGKGEAARPGVRRPG
ncbi:MAG TPA: NAD(P)/FAD-dependent oxidoreductase [Actinomycetes bacterium]|nr:NAD(P)/FAD-dependent oxidoreductase [Actinomycetes bacterium]